MTKILEMAGGNPLGIRIPESPTRTWDDKGSPGEGASVKAAWEA
jgi:hypothetical protein